MRPSTRTTHLPHIFIFHFLFLKVYEFSSFRTDACERFPKALLSRNPHFYAEVASKLYFLRFVYEFQIENFHQKRFWREGKSIRRTSKLVYSSEIETIRCRERFKLFSNRKIYSLSAKSANMFFYPVVDSTVDLRRIFERFSFLWEIQHNGW